MIRTTSSLFSTAICILVMGYIAVAAARADPPSAGVSVDDVARAWEDRSARVRTLRFKWHDRYTISSGFFLRPAPGVENPDNPHGLVVPEKTTTFDQSFSLVFDADKIRDEGKKILLSAEQKLVPQVYTWVVNDGDFRQLDEPGGARYPRGRARRADALKPPLRGDANLLPVYMVYRPFDPVVGTFPDFARRFHTVEGRFAVQERDCALLRDDQQKPSDNVTSIYVDRERDFLPMCMTRERNGSELYRVTFGEYERDGDEWVPMHWKASVFLGDGSVGIASASTVEKFAINGPVDSGEFELEFPPGTWVKDQESRTGYVMLDGGEKRQITHDELVSGAKYEDFLRTETGAARGAPAVGGAKLPWLWIVSGATAAAAVILFTLRKLKRA
jgi:hypothetical protein